MYTNWWCFLFTSGYTIDNVAKNRSKPAYGRKLEAWRAEVGLSLDELVAQINHEAIYKQLLYRLENGLKDPKTLTYLQTTLLANALKREVDELNYVLGVFSQKPINVSQSKLDDFRIAPMIGLAQAGKPTEYYPVPRTIYRPGMVVYQVSGNSMTTGNSDSLRDGDFVFCDTSLNELVEGKVYVVEVVGDGIAVKRARRLDNKWYLVSDNPEHESFNASDVRVIGQVYRAVGERDLTL
jgi:repressor LexA